MSEILVVYGSTEGQTEKVATRMAELARGTGHEVAVVPASRATTSADPGQYDAVIVGGSIHVGKQDPNVVEFAREHADVLGSMPAAFFEVCLSAASDDPERRAEAERYVDDFVAATGWDPDAVGIFAGALRFSEYGFVKRLLMKKIAADATGDTDTSRDYEYTDWDAVESFVEEFLATVEGESEPPEAAA